MKIKWKDAPVFHKLITVMAVLVSLSVVALAVLQMLGVWDQAINLCVPLMGVTMLCQAYTQWNTSRMVAYYSIATAAIIFACAIAVFALK